MSKTERDPSPAQFRWLTRGLDQPGGKLPLFDHEGKRVARRTIEACLARGWAERWFDNPTKPDWLVCRLTDEGRRLAKSHAATSTPPVKLRRESKPVRSRSRA